MKLQSFLQIFELAGSAYFLAFPTIFVLVQAGLFELRIVMLLLGLCLVMLRRSFAPSLHNKHTITKSFATRHVIPGTEFVNLVT